MHRCHQWIELSADGAAVFLGGPFVGPGRGGENGWFVGSPPTHDGKLIKLIYNV